MWERTEQNTSELFCWGFSTRFTSKPCHATVERQYHFPSRCWDLKYYILMNGFLRGTLSPSCLQMSRNMYNTKVECQGGSIPKVKNSRAILSQWVCVASILSSWLNLALDVVPNPICSSFCFNRHGGCLVLAMWFPGSSQLWPLLTNSIIEFNVNLQDKDIKRSFIIAHVMTLPRFGCRSSTCFSAVYRSFCFSHQTPPDLCISSDPFLHTAMARRRRTSAACLLVPLVSFATLRCFLGRLARGLAFSRLDGFNNLVRIN